MNLPDRIFAVGGAGKAITMKLLESEWVLRGILEPRPNPHSLTVTILDTAEGEQNFDRERIEELRDHIAELKSELRDGDSGRTGDIDIEYKLITSDIQLNGSIDLLGDRAVPRIAAGNGIQEDNWWLREEHINENLDFAKGVVRKRGLGKAIYYKAYAEDDDISTYIDLPDKGKVAIVVGLGGGTGSGLMIDLAKHLQEKQRTAEITLFGILPNHTEGIKESANAFAALSELEYLSYTDQQVFKDRVLVPIDPTGFDGKTGNRIQTDQMLEELDEAMVYLLAAYYNTQNLEDPFAESPQFAPFTIGIPQILRYNVEAINDARSALREILNTKEESLQAEEQIYSQIERFLTRNFNEEIDNGLRELDIADLNERLDTTSEILELDLFQELEYESLSVFEDIISDAKQEADDIDEQLEIIAGSLRAVDVTGQAVGNFVDNIDEHLAEVIEQDLRLTAQRKNILKQLQVIDDSRIRDAIEYLIGTGTENANPGVKLQRLEAQLDELRNKRDRLESDLEDTEQELKELQEEQAGQIERKVESFERAVEQDLDQLQQLSSQPIESDLNSLRTALEDYNHRVTNASSPEEAENIEARNVREQLDNVEDLLETVGISFEEKRRNIEGSLTALRNVRGAFLRMNQEESTFERLTPWTSSTEEEQDEAHKEYRIQKSKLDDDGIFSVGPPSGQFASEVTFESQDLLDRVHERRERLMDNVTNELASRLDTSQSAVIEDLEAELSTTPELSTLSEVARRGFRNEIEGTTEIEERRDELTAEIEDLDARVELFEATIDSFQDLNSQRDAYVDNLSKFNKRRAEYDDESDRSVATRTEDYVYVKNIQPEDVFRVTGDADISKSDLFKSRKENQRLRNHLEDLAQNARDQQYTGLYRRKFSRGTSRYDELKVRTGVTSRAVHEIETEALDFEDTFSGAFDLGASGKRVESPYTSWQRDIGGSWDIGLSVFIDGVFFDNIRKVVQADGYHSGYERRASELGNDILIHHSHGLDEGYFTRRRDLLNLEADEDIELLLQNENDVAETIMEEYFQVVKVGGDTEPVSFEDDLTEENERETSESKYNNED